LSSLLGFVASILDQLYFTFRQVSEIAYERLAFGQMAATATRRVEFHKRSQLFVSADNETLSVVAVRVNNPDRSSLAVNG
jgi:hypothetical protein